jgi:hypothetical protein
MKAYPTSVERRWLMALHTQERIARLQGEQPVTRDEIEENVTNLVKALVDFIVMLVRLAKSGDLV